MNVYEQNYRQASSLTYRPCRSQHKFPDGSCRLVLASLPEEKELAWIYMHAWITQCICWKFCFPWQSVKLEEDRDHNPYVQEHIFLNKAVANTKIKLLILKAVNYTQYIHFMQLSHMHPNTLTCSYQIKATAGRQTPAISSEAVSYMHLVMHINLLLFSNKK